MATKIQLRRDTAANWTSNNPTLSSGEVGVETDTLKFKIGDGSTAWTALTYQGSTYGDSDVATLLGSFGSNTISTTGTVTTGLLNAGPINSAGISATGNISVTGLLNAGPINSGDISASGNINATGSVVAGGGITGAFTTVAQPGDGYANTFSSGYNWNASSTANNTLTFDSLEDQIPSLNAIGTSAPRVTFQNVTGANASLVNGQVFYLGPIGGDDGYNFELFTDAGLTQIVDRSIANGLDNSTGEMQYDYFTFNNTVSTQIDAGYAIHSINNNPVFRARFFTGAPVEFVNFPVLPSHSNLSLPTATGNPGGMIYVTNGNDKPAYSNGTNWYYVDDNTQVS